MQLFLFIYIKIKIYYLKKMQLSSGSYIIFGMETNPRNTQIYLCVREREFVYIFYVNISIYLVYM